MNEVGGGGGGGGGGDRARAFVCYQGKQSKEIVGPVGRGMVHGM